MINEEILKEFYDAAKKLRDCLSNMPDQEFLKVRPELISDMKDFSDTLSGELADIDFSKLTGESREEWIAQLDISVAALETITNI